MFRKLKEKYYFYVINEMNLNEHNHKLFSFSPCMFLLYDGNYLFSVSDFGKADTLNSQPTKMYILTNFKYLLYSSVD